MAKKIIDGLNVEDTRQNLWTGRFDCNKCHRQHFGVSLDDDCCDYIIQLCKRQTGGDIEGIIKTLQEGRIDDGENVSDNIANQHHNFTLEFGTGKIPDLEYLGSFLKGLIRGFDKEIDENEDEIEYLELLKERKEMAQHVLKVYENSTKQLTLTEEQRTWLSGELRIMLDGTNKDKDFLQIVEELLRAVRPHEHSLNAKDRRDLK